MPSEVVVSITDADVSMGILVATHSALGNRHNCDNPFSLTNRSTGTQRKFPRVASLSTSTAIAANNASASSLRPSVY